MNSSENINNHTEHLLRVKNKNKTYKDVTICDDCNSSHKHKEVPDGGWGWMVVFSAFIINVLSDGCSYSFGILLVHLVEYFDANRSQTAWIGSVLNATPLLCGPIASILNDKFGYRKATILGGFIVAVGFSASALADSLWLLCITYGVVAGFGISIPYLTSVVILKEYFRKKLSLVSGICQSGAGVGTIVFAPLLEWLISEFGWRGAVLIVGGLNFNLVVCGAIMRPTHSRNLCITKICDNKSKEKDLPAQTSYNEMTDKNQILFSENIQDGSYLLHVKQINKPQYLKRSSSCPVDVNNDYDSLQVYNNKDIASSFSSMHKMAILDFHQMTKSAKDLNFSNSELPEISSPSLHFENTKLHTLRVCISSLFCPAFVVFVITNFILFFWFDVPYMFTVDRLRLAGIHQNNAAITVSVIGALNTFGNILYGFLGDRKNINKSILYCISLGIWGTSLILMPFFTTYWISLVLGAVCGLFSACCDAYGSVILIDILGGDSLNKAYGTMMFVQGIANLFGPPFAGWLFDSSGDYIRTFLIAGVSIIVGGCLYLSVPCCCSLRRNQPTEKDTIIQV